MIFFEKILRPAVEKWDKLKQEHLETNLPDIKCLSNIIFIKREKKSNLLSKVAQKIKSQQKG